MRISKMGAVAASVLLVAGLLPAPALAEATSELLEPAFVAASPQEEPLVAAWRLSDADDAAWQWFLSREEAEEQARATAEEADPAGDTVDVVPVKNIGVRLQCGDEEASDTVEMRVRTQDEEWPADDEGWAGSSLLVDEAFVDLQARVGGDVAETHDLWYRVRAGGAWSEWVSNGDAALAPEAAEAVDDVQFVLVAKEEAPVEQDAQQDGLDPSDEGAAASDEDAAASDGDSAASDEDAHVVADANAEESAADDETVTDDTDAADAFVDATWEGDAAQADTPAPIPAPTQVSVQESTRVTVQKTPNARPSSTLADVLASKVAATPAKVAATPAKVAATPAKKTDPKTSKDQPTTAREATTREQAQEPDPKTTEPAEQAQEETPKQRDPLTLSAQAQTKVPIVSYNAHVQNIGWQQMVSNGAMAGTSGRGLRVEALHISLESGTDGGITYRGHVQNVGWQNWVRDGEVVGTSGRGLRVEALEIKLTGNVEKDYDVWYRGHVQNIGWQNWVKNGALCGTSGRGLRVEALQIILMPKGSAAPAASDTATIVGTDKETKASITYRASVANMGWQGWMRDGERAGSTGIGANLEAFNAQLIGLSNDELLYTAHLQNEGWKPEVTGGHEIGYGGRGLRMEALKIRLSGTAEKNYDIYYRTHIQNYGWLNWAKNGAPSGSSGMGLRIEALEVMLVAKGENGPSESGTRSFVEHPTLTYRGHVQNIGWQNWVGEGGLAGTSGRGLRVEALSARITGTSLSGAVQLNAHVQNIGWQDTWGETAGTSGRGLRVEALQARLTGELANAYDIYYRVHAQNVGWMGWAKNGEQAGTSGLGLRLEGIEMRLVNKGAAAPGTTAHAFINGSTVSKMGYQNPAGFYQVSRFNVTITRAAVAPFNYVTPSRIGVWASRQECVNAFLQRAREYVGTPYVWNYACAPGVGVDCIGLVYQCAYACGMDLGGGTGDTDFNPWAHWVTGNGGWHSHDANNFWYFGKAMHVPVSSRQAGDVLYWPGHVAIYMGGNTLVEAYTAQTGTIYSSLSSRPVPSGCIRLFQ